MVQCNTQTRKGTYTEDTNRVLRKHRCENAYYNHHGRCATKSYKTSMENKKTELVVDVAGIEIF
jgi:hypothetical protein